MPVSVSHYVLKVHSRCDLACDDCYVYRHADQSWRVKPRALDVVTARQAALRISDHARQHRLGEVNIVLHGGEPLLLGHDGMREVVYTLRSLIDPVTRLDLRIHTNGVLLDERFCELFADYDVRVGVSLDGDRTANDRHRRFADGRSSHAQVRQALALLRKPEYRHLYTGILCTIDVANDPIAVYDALLAEAPPRIDLLLPHATWDKPPHHPAGVRTPYADWLGQIHARWVNDGHPVPIRLFDSLLAAWEGRRSSSEAAGLDPVDLLVIDTDGSWEQADSLKTAFDGAPATGFDIFSHSVDEAAAHPGVAIRQAGLDALCATCRACPLVRACGGGLYAHRYKSGSGFDNPSVYCADLKVLIPQVTASQLTVAASAAVPSAAPPAAHALPEGAFDALAAGPGDSRAMASLAEARWSVTRALVAAVASSLDGTGGDLGRAAAEGWVLLADLDAERPEAVREVLTYPYVQEWATRCLRPAQSADVALDRAHLAGLAAAAALRAGIEVELVLPVRDGFIYLPGIGALAMAAGAGSTSAVRLSPSGLSSRHSSRGWHTVRRVSAGGMAVTVEDIDPFRDCQAWAPTRRLPEGAWRAWRLGLAAAARQLATELPAYASVIGAGLRSVVPMRSGTAGHRESGTARQAFGAVAMALPEDAGTLSALLVHEMQHLKLTALGDLFDLFDRTDSRRFRVPWRPDPRPVEGLLHGTYAHLAVAELWRARALQQPGGQAQRHFCMYRSAVEGAIEVLLTAGSLLPDGHRFVKGMQMTAETWAYDR
jgi:uncharacterized protein